MQATVGVAFEISKIKCNVCKLNALGRKFLGTGTGTFPFTFIISAST